MIGGLVEAYLNTLPTPYPGWRSSGAADPVAHSRIKGAERKREGWKQAQPFWGKLRVKDIDKDTSREYQLWRAKAANTMRHELGPVSSALKWAVEAKLIDTAPRIFLPGIPDSVTPHLTKVQFKAFLEGCTAPHVRLFAVLAVTTGARAAALLQLPWESVAWDRGLIHLKPPNVPTGAL
jgi:integrase